ncbi:MAG: tetratricopeptide repeat protein [Terriglobia bacterium]
MKRFCRSALQYASAADARLPGAIASRFIEAVALCVLFAAAGRAGTVAGHAGDEQAVVNRAHALVDAGNAPAAVSLLRGWLQSHPRETAARVFLARVYEAAGDSQNAETELQVALKYAANDPRALTALGVLYDRLGRAEQAEPLLAAAAKAARDRTSAQEVDLAWATSLTELHRYAEAAAALDGVPPPRPLPQHIAYLRLKASVALGVGDANDAAKAMEAALRLAPEDRNLQLATAVAEMEARRWPQAAARLGPLFDATHDPRVGLDLLQAQVRAHAPYASTLERLRSLKLPPKQELTLRAGLGEALFQSGLNGEASEEFSQAIKLAPNQPDLYYDLALAEFHAGRLEAGLASAQRAQSLEDSGAVEGLIGDIEEKRGDSLAAVHSYQKAVSLAPGNEQYWTTLGLDLLRHQTYSAALIVFEKAASKFPQSLRIHVALGLTQYFLEHYAEAANALIAAGRLDPNSPLAYNYLGEIQLQQPVTPNPGAVRVLCRFADLHPGQAEAMAYCGALLARGEHDRGAAAPSADALRRLRAAASAAPNDATARCEFGKALEWNRQWQAARSEMEACLRLNPGSAEAYYRLARIDSHLGQTAMAAREMKLHDQAVRHMVEANTQHDAVLEKFLFSVEGTTPP